MGTMRMQHPIADTAVATAATTVGTVTTLYHAQVATWAEQISFWLSILVPAASFLLSCCGIAWFVVKFYDRFNRK